MNTYRYIDVDISTGEVLNLPLHQLTKDYDRTKNEYIKERGPTGLIITTIRKWQFKKQLTFNF